MAKESQVPQILEQGIAAAKAGRKEEARQALMQVVELDERNEQGWLWLSGVVETQEDRRICLENVLAINPDNAHAKSGLEWLVQQAPAADHSEERCPRCQKPLPPTGSTCPHCDLPLVVACPGCGQYVDVARSTCPECNRTLGDFREGAGYHLALAHGYVEARQFDRAQEAIARAEADSPGDPRLLEATAALEEATGRLDPAIVACEQALAQDPKNASLHVRLGVLYAQRGQTVEARTQYEEAARLAGDDAELLYKVAGHYLEDDVASPEGLDLLDRVVKLDPGHAEAHLRLGDTYLRRKDKGRAKSHYEQASQLAAPDSKVGQEASLRLARLEVAMELLDQAGRAGGKRSASAQRGERPGCITVYAILTGMSALFGCFGGAMIAIALTAGQSVLESAFQEIEPLMPLNLGQLTGIVWAYVAIVFVVAGLNLAITIGLWNMKNWARIIVIGLQGLGLLGNIYQAVSTILQFRELSTAAGIEASFPLPALLGLMVGLLIQGYILFWFAVNADLFN
jgi:tetratricopeptide (TPR) repeat protein